MGGGGEEMGDDPLRQRRGEHRDVSYQMYKTAEWHLFMGGNCGGKAKMASLGQQGGLTDTTATNQCKVSLSYPSETIGVSCKSAIHPCS